MRHLGWLFLVVVMGLAGCVTSRSAGTAEGTPVTPLPGSPCDSADFERRPDLERLELYVREPTRLRGILNAEGQILNVGGSSYHLRGVTFSAEDDGRIVELYGQLEAGEALQFAVDTFKFMPLTVLQGRLRTERRCKMACNDWLLWDVTAGETTTATLALTWSPDEYPDLWAQAGTEVTLAGDLYEINWSGLQPFKARYVCAPTP